MTGRRLAVALVAWIPFSAACGGSSSSPTSPSAPLPSLDVMLAEKVLGNAAASVTMIDYSSLTCPHCADFHATTLPQIKASYIDSGRVKFVYRDFPLDNSAVSAAMVARCSGDNYFSVLDLLYRGQANWTNDLVAGLKRTVAPAGMSTAQVDTCLANNDLRNGIVNMRTAGQNEFGISGTPTFIINGQKVVGAQPYATFDAILRGLLP